jgi:hypothetical protein
MIKVKYVDFAGSCDRSAPFLNRSPSLRLGAQQLLGSRREIGFAANAGIDLETALKLLLGHSGIAPSPLRPWATLASRLGHSGIASRSLRSNWPESRIVEYYSFEQLLFECVETTYGLDALNPEHAN